MLDGIFLLNRYIILLNNSVDIEESRERRTKQKFFTLFQDFHASLTFQSLKDVEK